MQFDYKREVYYERTVQVEFPVISLRVNENAMLRKTIPSIDEIYQDFLKVIVLKGRSSPFRRPPYT